MFLGTSQKLSKYMKNFSRVGEIWQCKKFSSQWLNKINNSGIPEPCKSRKPKWKLTQVTAQRNSYIFSHF